MTTTAITTRREGRVAAASTATPGAPYRDADFFDLDRDDVLTWFDSFPAWDPDGSYSL